MWCTFIEPDYEIADGELCLCCSEEYFIAEIENLLYNYHKVPQFSQVQTKHCIFATPVWTCKQVDIYAKYPKRKKRLFLISLHYNLTKQHMIPVTTGLQPCAVQCFAYSPWLALRCSTTSYSRSTKTKKRIIKLICLFCHRGISQSDNNSLLETLSLKRYQSIPSPFSRECWYQTLPFSRRHLQKRNINLKSRIWGIPRWPLAFSHSRLIQLKKRNLTNK